METNQQYQAWGKKFAGIGVELTNTAQACKENTCIDALERLKDLHDCLYKDVSTLESRLALVLRSEPLPNDDVAPCVLNVSELGNKIRYLIDGVEVINSRIASILRRIDL